MVLTAAYVSLAGIERSGDLNKAELSAEVEEKDVTTFKSLGWKEVVGGLKSGSLALSFKNDLAAAAVDQAMWDALGTVVPFVVRASQAAVGTSNPQYSGNVLVKSWTPIAGAPGDVNESNHTYPTSGPVVRATA
ncbi:hypothetical protein OOK41_01335 [Micromonospora sp. NBC_01655]|uniref:hypothetical protein n=1 Tax=Micromonospora sp. NBC_01655 TaxID=2975983 RepID=UPI0022594256|nr:hypothetical protein [Micromonospora sp. NBC_01655]MCX4468967.1 hypothetical protein [Micromonospora sp. NBC_01655]